MKIRHKKENSQHLVIVLTRNYSTGLSVIRALGSSGFVVDVIVSTPKEGQSVIVSKSKYVRRCMEIVSEKYGTGENPELFEALMSYKGTRQEKIMLFPTDDYTSSVVNYYRSALTEVFFMPGMDSDEFQMEHFMDKSVQCEIAQKAGFYVPQTHILSLREWPVKIPENIIFPCFCKPLSSYSGQKVEMAKCNNMEELKSHLEKVRTNYSDRDFLVQEYIEIEEEIAVEGYSFGDTSIVPGYARKLRVAQWETGVSVVGKLLPVQDFENLEEKVKSFMRQIQYYGLFDVDLMVSKNQIYFTEVNFRSGGLTSAFVQGGVNLPELFVRNLYGLGHQPKEEVLDAYGVTFIYEMMAWEDCIHGYMTREELRGLHESVNFHIIDDPRDPAPYEHYLKNAEHRLRMRKMRIQQIETSFGMNQQDSDFVMAVAHETKTSWMKAQREMQSALELRGISYESYLKNRLWEQKIYDSEIEAVTISSERYLQDRMFKIYNCKLEEEKLYIAGQRSYKKSEDRYLTKKEKKRIDNFWKQYEFAVAAPDETIQAYTNRSGIFHPAYVSPKLKQVIMEWACAEKYRMAFQNKFYVEKLLSHAVWPKKIISCISGIYFDENWNRITLKEGAEICTKKLSEQKRMVLNKNANYANPSPFFLSGSLETEVEKELKTLKTDFMITEELCKHEFEKSVAPEGMCIVRFTTLLWKEEVLVLAGLAKISNDAETVLVGLTKDGRLYPWAMNASYEKVDRLPSGVTLNQVWKIPFFEEAIQMIQKSHLEIPMIKIITWEMRMTEKGAVLVNLLFNGDWREHQALTGPLFGDLSKEIFDEILKDNFSKNKADLQYDYQEFEKFVRIIKYAGDEEVVTLPAMFHRKKITTIGEKAFKDKSKLKKLTIPEGIKYIREEAFANCSSLEEVILPESLVKIKENAFLECKKLSQVTISEKTKIAKTSFAGCLNLSLNKF